MPFTPCSRLSTPTLGLVTCALFVLACAEASAPTPVGSSDLGQHNDDRDMNAMSDLPVSDMPASDMTAGDMDPAPDANTDDMPAGDLAPDLPPMPSYAVCALVDPADPFGACAPDTILDFGFAPAAQPVTRVLRLDNDGPVSFSLTATRVPGLNPTLQLATWSTPPNPARTSAQAPLALAPGESAFVEVTLTGPINPVDLAAFALEADLNVGQAAPELVSVPLAGLLGGCAPNTRDCNLDPTDGCEVDTSADPANCGMCGRACAFTNATALCVNSQCSLGACAQGFDNCNQDPADGCEVDIFNRLADCGACNNVCDLPGATESCIMGACTFNTCEGAQRDCNQDPYVDGCEINISNNVAHCGGCNMPCNIPGADATCQSSQCVFAGCRPGFYNLNGSTADGCEYACSFTSADDQPDNGFIDANCDGIDGTISRAIFVARDGSDSGNGSMSSPYRTIAKALSVAANTSGLDHVYISEGTYNEQLFLVNGVSLFGGYQRAFGWRRSAAAVTRVYWDVVGQNRIITIQGTNLTLPTTLDRLLIEAGSASGGGVSVYAFYCRTCPGLRLTNNTILAGDAGRGQDGTPGTTPSARGYAPVSGGAGGQCDGDTPGNGGPGGASDCGRTGGGGGRGGEISSAGTRGGDGAGGTLGGHGGSSGDPGRRGADGADGADGSPGAAGSGGGGQGQVQNDFWIGEAGGAGSPGSHGNGGGGGGGGGGQGGCFPCNRGGGNGGGGGGGGGCGGTGGGGGTAGGSSFGVFLHSSTGAQLSGNTITSGAGGRGGDGAFGGAGSLGGAGAAGAQVCTGEVGGGGTGGRGGQGGTGGRGGGGAGGHSYAVYRHATTIGLPGSNTLTPGSPGQGGTGGNNGAAGTAAAYRP
jgi:hypothetical protein